MLTGARDDNVAVTVPTELGSICVKVHGQSVIVKVVGPKAVKVALFKVKVVGPGQ